MENQIIWDEVGEVSDEMWKRLRVHPAAKEFVSLLSSYTYRPRATKRPMFTIKDDYELIIG